MELTCEKLNPNNELYDTKSLYVIDNQIFDEENLVEYVGVSLEDEPSQDCDVDEKILTDDGLIVLGFDSVSVEKQNSKDSCKETCDNDLDPLYEEKKETDNVVEITKDTTDLEPSHVLLMNGKKYYPCPYESCGKFFSNITQYKAHIKVHTVKFRNDFKCHICDKEFGYLYSWKIHQRVHNGERPYPCKFGCGKTFKTSSDELKHFRSHTNDRRYMCTYTGCDKAFTQVSNYKQHLATHTGYRQYKCTECNKSFARLTNLHSHERIHSGEKPFKCDICGKCFTEYSSMYKHKRVHARDKFKCSICPLMNFDKRNLDAHMKKFHPDYDADEQSN